MAKMGFVKEYDKDLKLYQDFAKTLIDYRLSLFSIVSRETYIQYKNHDKDLLNRLAKRLDIKTLDKNIYKKNNKFFTILFF